MLKKTLPLVAAASVVCAPVHAVTWGQSYIGRVVDEVMADASTLVEQPTEIWLKASLWEWSGPGGFSGQESEGATQWVGCCAIPNPLKAHDTVTHPYGCMTGYYEMEGKHEFAEEEDDWQPADMGLYTMDMRMVWTCG